MAASPRKRFWYKFWWGSGGESRANGYAQWRRKKRLGGAPVDRTTLMAMRMGAFLMLCVMEDVDSASRQNSPSEMYSKTHPDDQLKGN